MLYNDRKQDARNGTFRARTHRIYAGSHCHFWYYNQYGSRTSTSRPSYFPGFSSLSRPVYVLRKTSTASNKHSDTNIANFRSPFSSVASTKPKPFGPYTRWFFPDILDPLAELTFRLTRRHNGALQHPLGYRPSRHCLACAMG